MSKQEYQGELPGFPTLNPHFKSRRESSERMFPDGHFKELKEGHIGKVIPPKDTVTWARIQRKDIK